MTIFVLIPVCNRVRHTQGVIAALRRQSLAKSLCMVVINDGSTDGTSDYLKVQGDVVELIGDGNLWWGGAIQKGLEYVLKRKQNHDYVLFLNNDTRFDPDYVETLVRVSRQANGAAVGSVIHEIGRDAPLVSVGPRVDINRLKWWDLLNELRPEDVQQPGKTFRVDALSGRGTLYPAVLFERFGGMRPRLLPHYLADYEIAMRFARRGVPLVVSIDAVVYSEPVYGNDVSSMGWWDSLFSIRSSSNVIRRLAFYMLVGSPLQRLTAPLRMTLFGAWRVLALLKLS